MSKKGKEKRKRDPDDDDDEAPLGGGIDFTIDAESVKDEYTRVPSFIATLNAVYAQALKKAILAKFNRDRVFATISVEIAESAVKKPAEAQIKNMVLLDDRYVAAIHAYANAEEQKSLAAGRAQAMIAKKDMLVSLGAHVRKEFDGQGGLDSEGGELDLKDEDEDDD